MTQIAIHGKGAIKRSYYIRLKREKIRKANLLKRIKIAKPYVV